MSSALKQLQDGLLCANTEGKQRLSSSLLWAWMHHTFCEAFYPNKSTNELMSLQLSAFSANTVGWVYCAGDVGQHSWVKCVPCHCCATGCGCCC